MKGLGIGRVVHFVMPNGEHRPAFVVKIWDQQYGTVNLQVFTDGSNDGSEYSDGIFWGTSVPHNPDPMPYSWHWPERVE